MGCAISKEVNKSRPSNGTSWRKVVPRELTAQADRSLKTSNGGYVAAVFSSKSDIVKYHAPVKALEKHESLQKLSGKGSYPQHKANAVPEKTKKQSSEKPSRDTVLGIPILSTDQQESKEPTAEKENESTNENLETVNILELMEGLAEAEVCANIEHLHANHELLMPSTQVVDRPDKATDDARMQKSGIMAARRPQSRSFSSFNSIEDVDRALSEKRSESPPPIKSSRKASPVDEHRKISSNENVSQKSTSLTDTNIDIDSLICKRSSNTADTVALDKAFQNPGNLRALSFKYMLNDHSSKKLDCLISDLNPAPSQINEGSPRIYCSRECLIVTAPRLWGEGEGASTYLSPEFSPAISFKDWLPSTNYRPLSFPYWESGSEPSSLDVFQPFPSYASTSHHSSDNMKVQTMSQEGTTSVFTRVEEEDGVPVFDPEMLDSFENAMKSLSKEEWDAVRGMEDSPRNFLRLVKALKKSSSNSMCNQNAFVGPDPSTEAAEPFDMKLKRLSVEKKLAYMRQNSLEVKKALAKQLSSKQGRANVVFYSSTTQVNAKMYADCNQVRNILQSLVGVSYDERSISELSEHEQELSYALNISAVIVPTIYVKGKYLVGIDSIMQLYKRGLLDSMLQEAVSFGSKTSIQCICRGSKFLSCPFCKGRRKLSRVGEGTVLCRYCSGTGLIKCLSCSST